jgi:hypothetical protein
MTPSWGGALFTLVTNPRGDLTKEAVRDVADVVGFRGQSRCS